MGTEEILRGHQMPARGSGSSSGRTYRMPDRGSGLSMGSGSTRTGVLPSSTLLSNRSYGSPSAPSTAGIFGGPTGGLGTPALPQAGGLGAALSPTEGTLSLGSIGSGIGSGIGGIMNTVTGLIPIAVKIILAIIVIKIVLWLLRGRR